jgi:hypothetical protein
MRQQIATRLGTGSSNVITTDTYISPFNVGFGVVVTNTGDSATNYTVQHTFDNPQTTPSPTWFNHPTVASLTASQDGNYAFPVAAIRVSINSVSGSGTGSVRMTVIQSGIV